MHKMKKNRRFFSGKNHIIKNQDNSKPFYAVGNSDDNVSFINARRNTRTFNEQNNSNFGHNANRFNKQINSNTYNKERHKKDNQKNNTRIFNKNQKSNNNQKFQQGNFQNPQSGKYQNPEVAKYIANLNFKDLSQIILAINEQFQKIDLQKLHAIDEKLLDEAIVSNNKQIAELALIAYAYRKLISKKHIFYNTNWKKFKDKSIADLKLASELSKKPDLTEFTKKIKDIQTDIENTDKLLGHFVHDIIFNARAKLASSAYASGLSLSRATNLLSADKDSVMELLGQTKIPDEDSRIIGKTLKEKVNILKGMTIQKNVIKK
jgi:hypothetical protein